MNPVRQAIFGLLRNDPELVALSTGGIHHGKARQGTVTPYTIFYKSAGNPLWDFGDNPLQRELWAIKGVCQGNDAGPAEAIRNRLRVLCHDAGLAIEGHEHLYMRRESDLEYPEEHEGTDPYYHSGDRYRIWLD